MPSAVIDDPVINSPFEAPKRHFRFGEDGITNEIIEERRRSSYFIPIPPPKKKGKRLSFDTEWREERVRENDFINRVRTRVDIWRTGGYAGITRTTRRLLEYWTDSEREKRLFFCQIEALETVIYLTEVANRYGDAWIENDLREWNQSANPDLFRVAFKMATGSGKTVVMAMLIELSELVRPQGRSGREARSQTRHPRKRAGHRRNPLCAVKMCSARRGRVATDP